MLDYKKVTFWTVSVTGLHVHSVDLPITAAVAQHTHYNKLPMSISRDTATNPEASSIEPD